jgi:hypothetical protein
VAQPYDGSNLQVFALIAYLNDAEHFLQPGAEPASQDFWSWAWNFTTTTNPRDTKVNGHTDSLMNQTSLPYIKDHQEKIPGDLVTAVAEQKVLVLNIFLENHW